MDTHVDSPAVPPSYPIAHTHKRETVRVPQGTETSFSNAAPLLLQQLTCQFNVHVGVQQQVLCLQVTVDDVMLVTVLNSIHYLPELSTSLHLRKAANRRQIVFEDAREERQV